MYNKDARLTYRTPSLNRDVYYEQKPQQYYYCTVHTYLRNGTLICSQMAACLAFLPCLFPITDMSNASHPYSFHFRASFFPLTRLLI